MFEQCCEQESLIRPKNMLNSAEEYKDPQIGNKSED